MPTIEASIYDGMKIMEQQSPIPFKFYFLIVESFIIEQFF